MGEGFGTGSDGSEGRYPVLEAIAQKCARSGVETELDEAEEGPGGETAMLWVAFPEDPRLPDGSPEYILWIDDGPHARFALAAPFEQYRQFRGRLRRVYDAMWSETLGALECELVPCDRPPGAPGYGSDHQDSVDGILAALGHDVYSGDDHDADKRVRFAFGDGAEVSIGPASDAWVVRTFDAENTDDYEDLKVRRVPTLRIEGVELPDQDRAEAVLERAGNAALFELDRALGIGLRLATHTWGKPERGDVSGDLPARLMLEYDRGAMSLYWYARSAEEGMPLLGFLAYYQVLEFYFPRYSRRGAMQAVRDSLRGLSLDSLRDADLARVLDAVRVNRKGAFGNEAEQLKATLRHCVDQGDLRAFLEGNEERKRFYASDECTGISEARIPVGGSSVDWRGDVARRIYDIRNRVVHAKGQHADGPEPLLPFDAEANLLWHDVGLAAFLAREALSASAAPFGALGEETRRER